ncbi:MAG: hypothetical protein J6J42_04565 [Lachnospiraceae bacterium]|nr:hypothetical protein [Lachnospiraceae bacterium]
MYTAVEELCNEEKRVTLRGVLYQCYSVKEYENSRIMSEPQKLVVQDTMSVRTLEDMDKAMSNFKMGGVSPAIELSGF